MAANDASAEFSIERTYDAPRERVWAAFTTAEGLAHWWGPKGSTLKVLNLDLRPGGMFHYSMEYQPGHPMYGRFIYREIEAPQRIVFATSFSDVSGGITRAPFPQMQDRWPLEVLNTVTFTERAGRTTLALRGHPINANEQEIATFAGFFDSMRQGFGGTFDQLETYLAAARAA